MLDHEYVRGWMTHAKGGKSCKVCGGSLSDHYKPMLVDGVEPVTGDPYRVRLCACGDPSCADPMPCSCGADDCTSGVGDHKIERA